MMGRYSVIGNTPSFQVGIVSSSPTTCSNIGVWASLVSHSLGARNTAGSNPATPTIWCYSVMANTSDFLSEKFGFESQ